ncbi:5-(carboxyamino)imidazole ribonucleotide mutase [Eggerthellaceae bacterium PR-HUZ602407-17]
MQQTNHPSTCGCEGTVSPTEGAATAVSAPASSSAPNASSVAGVECDKDALVGVIMGSKSDLPCMQACIDMLRSFEVPVEVIIASAHRNPDKVHEWAGSAKQRGLKVIIAAAGKAAHLGGVVAAYTPLPVITVPMKTSDLGGLDSLLSMVQMPTGVPVACVAINGAKNAAILALQMLALCGQPYDHAMEEFKKHVGD